MGRTLAAPLQQQHHRCVSGDVKAERSREQLVAVLEDALERIHRNEAETSQAVLAATTAIAAARETAHVLLRYTEAAGHVAALSDAAVADAARRSLRVQLLAPLAVTTDRLRRAASSAQLELAPSARPQAAATVASGRKKT